MDMRHAPRGSRHGAISDHGAMGMLATGVDSPVPDRSPVSPFATLVDHFNAALCMRDTFRVRACGGNRLCLEVNPVLGAGRADLHRFHNGLTLNIGDYAFSDGLEEPYPALGPQFNVSIMLGGRLEMTALETGGRHHIATGQVWLRAGDIGPMRARLAAGVRMRGLSIDVPAAMAEEWREDGPRAFNTAIAGILASVDPVCARVPAATGRILEIADALVDANTETACGRLRAESLALGLLSEVLAPDATPDQITGIGARVAREKKAALDEAMDILRAEWWDPPTIAQVARRVGLNECYLMAGFRERFGTTIAGTIRALRMAEARRLIEREGQSVKQAAETVGYRHVGYFAAVFHRVHGCLPSSLGARRGGRDAREE